MKSVVKRPAPKDLPKSSPQAFIANISAQARHDYQTAIRLTADWIWKGRKG